MAHKTVGKHIKCKQVSCLIRVLRNIYRLCILGMVPVTTEVADQ